MLDAGVAKHRQQVDQAFFASSPFINTRPPLTRSQRRRMFLRYYRQNLRAACTALGRAVCGRAVCGEEGDFE